MTITRSSLFSEVKYYLKLSQEFQSRLSKYPHDWPQFQEIFNLTVEKIAVDILQFEKENINKFEAKVYKLKSIFEKRYRRYFLYGEFPKWVFEKPLGYAGDYRIIDDIYVNQPRTIGFDRLWDNYFQQMVASKATRERKEDLKRSILDFVTKHRGRDIRIMNLASGPAREIKELLEADSDKLFSNVIFDCYDFEVRAIDYAKQLLNGASNINFFSKNAIRLALKKDIKKEIPWDYDFIYSAGLYDYLDDRVTVRLTSNLKRLLRKDGMMVIANFGDKYSNSSAGLMEWATEWYLIYRAGDALEKIFLNAGFSPKNLKIIPQQGKVIQYCFANNTD